MRIVFFGSDDFAQVNLEALIHSRHQVLACVTQPNRAKARGWKVAPPIVKECALTYAIPVLQPLSLKEAHFIEQLQNYQADTFVVIAYGCFLPPEVLSLPRLLCINVHASLLPKYRGAAPIQWAIIQGEEWTGVSIIQMNTRMDAGDIITQEKVKIEPDDTAAALRSRMAALSAGLLMETLERIDQNDYRLFPQEESAVTLAPKLTKESGLILWEKSAREINNLVRGLHPWPTAYAYYQGKLLKILETSVLTNEESLQAVPGTILDVSSQGLKVAAGDGILLVRRVHPESSRAMDAASFALGHRVAPGGIFSSGS